MSSIEKQVRDLRNKIEAFNEELTPVLEKAKSLQARISDLQDDLATVLDKKFEHNSQVQKR
jgi:uncharacterized coiled-coil DUF342 family protein